MLLMSNRSSFRSAPIKHSHSQPWSQLLYLLIRVSINFNILYSNNQYPPRLLKKNQFVFLYMLPCKHSLVINNCFHFPKIWFYLSGPTKRFTFTCASLSILIRKKVRIWTFRTLWCMHFYERNSVQQLNLIRPPEQCSCYVFFWLFCVSLESSAFFLCALDFFFIAAICVFIYILLTCVLFLLTRLSRQLNFRSLLPIEDPFQKSHAIYRLQPYAKPCDGRFPRIVNKMHSTMKFSCRISKQDRYWVWANRLMLIRSIPVVPLMFLLPC